MQKKRQIGYRGFIKVIFLSLVVFACNKVCAQPVTGQIASNSHNFKIYLSFDDGPFPISKQLVDIAGSDSVAVNIFVTGRQVLNSPFGMEIFRLYKQCEFIKVFNHSYSHADSKYKQFYSKPAKVISDVLHNSDTLQLRDKIARLPGRNCWRVGNRKRDDLHDASIAADSLLVKGYSVLGWDIEWQYDTSFRSCYSAYEMLSMVTAISNRSFTPGHVVILCHDFMLKDVYSVQELKSFIALVKKNKDFEFGFLSEYPGIKSTGK